GDALDLRLAAELSIGADLACDAGDLRRERAQLIDHPVDDRGRPQELALDLSPPDLKRHLLGEVARRDRADDAADLVRGLYEVRDEPVDRFHAGRPGAARAAHLGALRELAFLADDAADALDLLNHHLVALDDVVDRLGDLAGDPRSARRNPRREVTILEG